ncbi:hypothetical protein P171DRAFT_515824 [Karstenula rhodostoma CBS 690.94]|uniref:Uncharacterized protein n=1 Tax=Karstenula rhodostoma CBS 690.94 TaxID=1392251 RepID=A0A9P4PZT0_9PLEO|nr:hypothetical protein P171DRAFT_515824 [Karstenula rhodostoma CBS 690.94]
MARFKDLPAELRLRVAEHLAHGEQLSENLRALALASRELAPIAQDVLFRSPAVNNRPRKKVFWINEAKQPSSELFNRLNQNVMTDPDFWSSAPLSQLERTLEERPAFAKRIRSLNMELVGEWRFLMTSNPGKDPSVACLHSINRKAYPYRRAAVLLSKLSRLEHLILTFKPPFEIPLHNNTLGNRLLQVAGFPHLTSLKTNCLPPPPILTMPSLRKLHINTRSLYFLIDSDYYDSEVDESDWNGIDAGAQNDVNYLFNVDPIREGLKHTDRVPQIRSLTIDLDAGILTQHLDHAIKLRICNELKKVLAFLDALESVQLRLGYDYTGCRRTYDEERLSYGELSGFLDLKNLRTVIIDTCELDWSIYSANIELDIFCQDCTADRVLPIHHQDDEFDNDYIPTNIPQLRRIVIPQEAFFHHHKYFDDGVPPFRPTPLPQTIESVEIIDSTRALNHWARYVLDHPGEYPNLKQVVLWCDRKQVPLGPEDRYRTAAYDESEAEDQVFGGAETYESYDVHDNYVLQDDVPDDVWTELEDSGISLVKHTKHDQGWRDAA